MLAEILAWSESTPAWVRDALRRVVTQPEISEADIAALSEQCKQPHGLAATAVETIPIAAEHVPGANTGTSVSLKKLTHVSDVNALCPNESIEFGATGLTVVYGDNGAGKSGYARILKRACRARGSADPVLANALSDRAGGAPTATLVVDVSGTERAHLWKDGQPCADELRSISVFDTSAAQVYVSDKTEVRFRPLGLDVLDRLATVAGKVKERLDGERRGLEQAVPQWPEVAQDTEAGRLLASLTALTARAEVDRIASLTEQELAELARLEEALAAARAEDPTKKAADLRLKAGRLNRLASELEQLQQQFGPDAVASLARKRQATHDSAAALGELVKQIAAHSRLPGVGGTAWNGLWNAAEAYSKSNAFPQHDFPNVEPGARCVLCQQELQPEARDRFSRFANFVMNQAKRTADARQQEEVDATNAIATIQPGQAKDAIEELPTLDAALATAVAAFLSAATASRDQVLKSDDGAALTAEPPVGALRSMAAALEDKAKELARTADPAQRRSAEQRVKELVARKALVASRERIHQEIDRKARINAYERCVRDTDTRGLTKLGTELTRKYVTEVLTKAFSEELTNLGLTTPELELREAGGQKGSLYHQIQLRYATKAIVPQVVSEGEGRCIALAAFLAELRSAGHTSAIVFDDPVSSLDHRWRTRVARRLVEEAKKRQVIVFTHELVFLFALIQLAEAAKVTSRTQSVRRVGEATGHVDPDLPWNALSTQKRIAWIRNQWQAAEKVFRVEGQDKYARDATFLYGRLRQSWERAVEEVLLANVVQRFRPSIETKRLEQIRDIQQSDLETVEAGMTKCSKWEGGHDQALAENEPVPPPDELLKDVGVLETWVKEVDARRKKKAS